jgi:tRNA:m4X modification enzyme
MEASPKKIKLADVEEPTEKPHCQFWVKRKSRFCKMLIKPNGKYCGEHEPPVIHQPTDENRILCPLDPTHSVMKYKLQKHLKICNARKKEVTLPYVKKNLNIGREETEEEDDSSFKLRDLPQNQLDEATKLVNDLFALHIEGKVRNEVTSHKIFDEELKLGEYGDEKLRHLLQASSILGILQKRELLGTQTCFIDLGAGKGHLSYWLSKLIIDEKIQDSKVLVVDRASHRHKRDNLFKELGVVERIRVDLADLDLKELTLDKCSSIVGVSKHLCGRATDFALRCLLNGSDGAVRPKGFLICLCCHHQITFDTFLGREWMTSVGIDRRTFNMIIKMASWCTSGDGRSREERKMNASVENDEKREEREEVGWRCKRLLDYARVKVMEEAGFDCGLSYYAEKSHTLENVCIVGRRRE